MVKNKSKFITKNIEKYFSELETYFKEKDSVRETLIKESREIIKLSKLIIYAIQSKDNDKVNSLTKTMTTKHKLMVKLVKTNPNYLNDGNFNIAEQELGEALLFKSLVLDHDLLSAKDLNIKPHNYVYALSDVTGELLRFAVIEVTNKNYDFVFELRNFVNAIYYLMLKLNLRGGEFRRKFDAVKYVLKKLDEISYDISKLEHKH